MEHEIKKHTSKLVSAVRNGDKPWKRRLGEILLEVGIIIFAVTFAAFIERKREHSHEQKEVKEFLIGLRTDLENDVKEMKDDQLGYRFMQKAFAYFARNRTYEADSLRIYGDAIYNYVHLVVNDGRYEGFKSSGKMNTIENIELRNAILDLYQEKLVALMATTQKYTTLKYDFRKVLYTHLRRDSAFRPNLPDVLQIPEINNYCFVLRMSTNEPVWRYDSAIVKSKQIIDLINREYGYVK